MPKDNSGIDAYILEYTELLSEVEDDDDDRLSLKIQETISRN